VTTAGSGPAPPSGTARCCTTNIAPHIGNRPIQKLTPLELEAWHPALRRSGRVKNSAGGGLCGRTIKNVHRLLARSLAEAVRHGLVAKNVADIEKPRTPEAEVEVEILRAGEVEEVLTKLAGDQLHAPAVVTLFTGLRRSEALALRWSSVDLERRTIQVRETIEETRAHGIAVGPPKTERSRRRISLPGIVVQTLRSTGSSSWSGTSRPAAGARPLTWSSRPRTAATSSRRASR
jgi:integrase